MKLIKCNLAVECVNECESNLISISIIRVCLENWFN